MSDLPTPKNAQSLFAGEDLACLRGERLVFRGLSFAVPAGGVLVLRGPNGTGKSSLLRLLAGLSRPEQGELRWDGEPIAADPAAHRARLHFLGHLDAIKPVLGVAESLSFWAGMRGADKEHIDRALAHFSLTRLASWPCRLLSAGERKRLALARLVASPAPLWLLDEPTTGLDAEAESDLMRAIAAHRAGGGRIVMATHAPLDLPEALNLSLADFTPRKKEKARAAA